MNFNQLKYFVALHKHNSYSKAAKALEISQPALTLQMKKLEEELDLKLIDKTHKPFSFTREGLEFLNRANEIICKVDSLKDLSFELGEEVSGYLRVGIIPTISPYLMPLFINDLNEKYPELTLEVNELKTEEIIEELKNGNIDCGILVTPIKNNTLVKKTLFYERFYLYVSEKHPFFEYDKVNISDINFNELWYLQEGNCFQNQVESICQFADQTGNSQHLIYRSNSIESLRRIVETKDGITFIPELATINIPPFQEDLVKEIEGKLKPLREVSLVTNKEVTKTRQIDAFVDILLSCIPKNMKQNNGVVIDTKI